ncbi:thiol-disulfide oxidoreductase DCC family protein [Sphingobacterium sp. E70]|uniref:thiol-disulfide oxidoreductase DCC family protein n=1 Tax=Sphingobacterium sp. E70 TaxID=2853439 RepID=UPI00359CAC10
MNEYARETYHLFDGDCLVCNRFVQILLKIDSNNRLLFSSLQSDFAKNNLHSIPKNIDSIVYISPSGTYIKSEAILNICKTLGLPYSIVYFLKILPKSGGTWATTILQKIATNGLEQISIAQFPTNSNGKNSSKQSFP